MTVIKTATSKGSATSQEAQDPWILASDHAQLIDRAHNVSKLIKEHNSVFCVPIPSHVRQLGSPHQLSSMANLSKQVCIIGYFIDSQ